jgi:RNA polymerase sigma-70 factor (ECF subfamily)
LKAPEHEADERLLIEAAQRDPKRFAALYERNFDRVYAYIARRVGDRDAAEDLTAEVFHHALASLPRFEWRGVPFAAWLLRIAANAMADRWQRLSREHGNPAPEEAAYVSLEEVESRLRLTQLVRALPKDQRSVLLSRFVAQKSIREIAQQLRRSEGAIKQLQFRALTSLRARMSRASRGEEHDA